MLAYVSSAMKTSLRCTAGGRCALACTSRLPGAWPRWGEQRRGYAAAFAGLFRKQPALSCGHSPEALGHVHVAAAKSVPAAQCRQGPCFCAARTGPPPSAASPDGGRAHAKQGEDAGECQDACGGPWEQACCSAGLLMPPLEAAPVGTSLVCLCSPALPMQSLDERRPQPAWRFWSGRTSAGNKTVSELGYAPTPRMAFAMLTPAARRSCRAARGATGAPSPGTLQCRGGVHRLPDLHQNLSAYWCTENVPAAPMGKTCSGCFRRQLPTAPPLQPQPRQSCGSWTRRWPLCSSPERRWWLVQQWLVC